MPSCVRDYAFVKINGIDQTTRYTNVPRAIPIRIQLYGGMKEVSKVDLS
jgi:hypothetical protein